MFVEHLNWPVKNSIKIERAIKGRTQAQLATLIGVPRQTIYAMELNKYVAPTVLGLYCLRYLKSRGTKYLNRKAKTKKGA